MCKYVKFFAVVGMMFCGLLLPCFAMAGKVEQTKVFETSFESSKEYKNPFMDVEVDVIFSNGKKEWKVPAFWDGRRIWKVRFAAPEKGDYSYHAVATDKSNKGLNTGKKSLSVTEYTGDNPLYKRGKLRVAKDQRHIEFSDGTPFLWLGDTWWKGLCKRISWEGFQQLSSDRKAKGFNVVHIVCGPYPDEPGMMQPSWENEGGMPYLDLAFSEVNPEYFRYADRRIEDLVDKGLTPAIVGGWGRAVNSVSAVGIDGFKRHLRNLVARYGAYPVVWIIGGETIKSQGPWYAAAQYLRSIEPYGRLLANHCTRLRDALEDHAVFDFDMHATGHNSWASVNHILNLTRKSFKNDPLKPFVSGESCYELHMQQNPAYLQRNQFWALMLAGAAGHTYGAAGIWHMATPEEHGNWGGWGGQPYDLTTWDEGMNFPGSGQLGRGKALLEELPWQQFKEHPEWVGKDVFAAGIPGKIRVIYQPIRGVYKWDGIEVKNFELGTWSAFYFDPVSGRRYDLGVHDLSGTWKSPNVPSPQDWVLVMQAQKRGKTVTLPAGKVGEKYSGKLEPNGAIFTKKSGGDWLTINPDGSYSGTPRDINAGQNSFLLSVKEPGGTESLVLLTTTVLGAGGEVFVESFGGYKGTQNETQAKTGLNVAYNGEVSGWTHSGKGAMHAVDRSFGGGQVTPSDWAIMIFDDNVITSDEIDANASGACYRVAFETSPAVYAQQSQATRAGDALQIDVLRKDGSVLHAFTHAPGKWNGKTEFSAVSFEYKGDGTGSVRLRIGSARDKMSGRFNGAVDNVVVRKVSNP